MGESSSGFEAAIAAIDAANADDPETIMVEGRAVPKELAHAELVSGWVRRLRPDASDELLLAARAHHVRRWEISRRSYPAGRAGYLRWRKTLHGHHAAVVEEVLTAAGYDDDTITRVQDLVRKRGLGRDPEVQVLEDALCLVFLETQLDDVAARLEQAKLVTVLHKTAAKMSPDGRDAARQLALPEALRPLLVDALEAAAGAPR